MAPYVPPHLMFACSFSCHLGHANVGPLAPKYSEFQGDTSTVLAKPRSFRSQALVFLKLAVLSYKRLEIALVYSVYCLFLSSSNINSTGVFFSVLLLCYICSRWNLFFDR